MTVFVRRHPVLAFAGLCVLPVHAILWPLVLMGVEPEALRPLKLLFAVLPTTVALLLSWIIGQADEVGALTTRLFRPRPGTRSPKAWVYVHATVSFLVLGAAALLVRSAWDGYRPGTGDFTPWSTALLLTPVLFAFPGFAEEFGWRGFMQERLRGRVGVFVSSLLVGLAWGTWHTMDFLMGNWAGGIYFVALFFAYIVGSSIIIGALYEWSGGVVLVAMAGHFSANAASTFLPLWSDAAGMRTPIVFLVLIWCVALGIGLRDVARN